jgi:predicted 3-demethylubiquinone-9 3-methyltransferase (glyoxalase superfamily)
MPRTIPCLWFDGQAEEAAFQYVRLFPNSEIQEITRYGRGAHQLEGSVMTISFTLDGQRYLGLNGGAAHTFTEAVSFQIMCADQAEVDHYWNGLALGGEEGPCGWLKDRFGLAWQVVPTVLVELLSDPDPERAQRATAAMMGMKKLDIAALHTAANGEGY